MRYLIFVVLLGSFPLVLSAQTFILRGRITDQTGQPVPFASIFKTNSTLGTSANGDGEYLLKLSPGKHDIAYKAIGYKQEMRSVDLKSNLNMDVQLAEAVYELGDVVVKSDAEDPAYEVIRNAIRRRKSHLNETPEYSAEVYIKGLQKLLAAPKKFLGRDIDDLGKQIGLDSNRTGIIYLSESESRLNFMAPDSYREEMISSKVSGSNRAFSFNRATDIKFNLYENLLDLDGLSSRPFVSPIADNALFYYDYRLMGTGMENGRLVNKIMLLPKRGADPVFRGEIYIIEDEWRIHSSSLYLTKQANINFVDTLSIRQEFIPVSSRAWMPSSVRYDFTGGLLGFKFGGYFLALYKNYDLKPGLKKRDFREVLNIQREVNKKDTAYWGQARPVPLTEEEQTDYEKKEVLAAKRESKTYLDSLDKAQNRFKPVSFLIGSGYTIRNRYKKEYIRFGSLINSVFYNTVEGFGINYEGSYSRQIDSLTNRYVRFTGKVRYGLSSEKLYGTVGGTLPAGSGSVNFNFGADVLDLNNLGTMSQLGNSLNSLLYERNFLKLYEKRFINVLFSRRYGGFSGTVGAEWASRRALVNTTDYTFRDLPNRVFTSNDPLDPASGFPMFPDNQSAKLLFRGTYDFSNEYATYPTGKVHQRSKYPTLGFGYVKGLSNVLGSDIDYDLLTVDLSRSDISLGLYGQFKFWLGAGKFVNNRSLYFPDFKHFAGNQSLSYTPKTYNFLFLDFYRFSTPDSFFEGHLEHNFSGFIMNKIPLVRKLKLKEVVGVNYLSTPARTKYSELYFGLEYLSFRVMYGYAFDAGKRADRGFRIAYGF